MSKLKLVLFDADGVLLDSLAQHLKICADKSIEYGLGLNIPSASEFKEMARRGTPISPMLCFFMAVGFPEEFARRANLQYQEIFMQKYAPVVFPGVYSMLQALQRTGVRMGIVTSNVKSNVVEALGRSIDFFPSDCIYSKDNMAGMSKSEAISSAMTRLQVSPSETIYVGDQIADWEAAKAAGVNFLGVTYGWGVSDEDRDFPIVKEVPEICRYISDWNTDQL